MTPRGEAGPPGLRWAVFGLAAAAFWLAFFHRVAPAAIAVELQSAFGLGGAMLGTLAATYYVVYTVMQVPTGVLNDTLGPRRVLTAGSIIAGAGSILFGLAETAAAAIAGRTVAGLGVSVAFVSLLKLNANWFNERRFATVSGLGATVGLTGALAAAAPLAWLVTLVSWRRVFIALGVASIALAGAIWLAVRDAPAGRVASAPIPGAGRWRQALAVVARNRATWSCFWVCFGMSGSYMAFVGLWAVPYLVHAHGRTVLEATQHTTLVILASAVCQALVGAWSDRIGRRRPIILGASILYFMCWAGWLAGLAVVPGASWALCAVMGFTLGGFTLTWSCAKEANPPGYAGTAISVVNIGGFLAVGLAQPFAGWLIDRAGAAGLSGAAQYAPGIALLAACALGGFVAALFIPETRCRSIWVDPSRQVPGPVPGEPPLNADGRR
ncbi:MAG: MFS transporter [Burkholderiales bacterium]|nr:MFS transporter [Burkholderiales bacterium]